MIGALDRVLTTKRQVWDKPSHSSQCVRQSVSFLSVAFGRHAIGPKVTVHKSLHLISDAIISVVQQLLGW